MSMKFQNRVFLQTDEDEVRRLIVLYQSIQSDQQQQLDRRCLSASNIAIASSSNSFNLRESSSRGGRLEQRLPNPKQIAGGQHVHFGPLAPGRSPVMKRRTLPSPFPTNRTAKTV